MCSRGNRQPPGRHAMPDFQHPPGPVQKDDVDGEAHEKGVNRVGRSDHQSGAGIQAVPARAAPSGGWPNRGRARGGGRQPAGRTPVTRANDRLPASAAAARNDFTLQLLPCRAFSPGRMSKVVSVPGKRLPLLRDAVLFQIPQKRPGHCQIRHPLGAQTDQPGASCVDRDKVLPHHERADLRARPMIGPSPSMPTMPSTIARPGLTVAARSTIEFSIPRKCSRFFGQP